MSEPYYTIFACWVIFHFFGGTDFFSSKSSFCQTVWIQIRIDVLLGLIWVQRLKLFASVNPLKTGNSIMGTLANSEDPDEMLHNVAFHQGLHCLLKPN